MNGVENRIESKLAIPDGIRIIGKLFNSPAILFRRSNPHHNLHMWMIRSFLHFTARFQRRSLIFQQKKKKKEIKSQKIQKSKRERVRIVVTHPSRWHLASPVDLTPESRWFWNWFSSRLRDVRRCVLDVGSRVQVCGYGFGKEAPSWIRHWLPKTIQDRERKEKEIRESRERGEISNLKQRERVSNNDIFVLLFFFCFVKMTKLIFRFGSTYYSTVIGFFFFLN